MVRAETVQANGNGPGEEERPSDGGSGQSSNGTWSDVVKQGLVMRQAWLELPMVVPERREFELVGADACTLRVDNGGLVPIGLLV